MCDILRGSQVFSVIYITKSLCDRFSTSFAEGGQRPAASGERGEGWGRGGDLEAIDRPQGLD